MLVHTQPMKKKKPAYRVKGGLFEFGSPSWHDRRNATMS
jgi:hypothetical protein